MSGICGVIHFDKSSVAPETIAQMAQAAAFRGPDGITTWFGEGVGLGYLALNITPESRREKQPLVSVQGNLVLVADARVDNRAELIKQLVPDGHLRTSEPTDADIILAAFLRWGHEMPAKIIGDFAFVIWDTVRRQLFAARDPGGLRCVYYRREPQRILFGSEVAQILAAPGVPARLFEPAVGAHLVGYSERQEWTFYEGITRLPASHALIVDDEGRDRVWRYWDFDLSYRIRYRDDQEYVDHLWTLFREAVGSRLRTFKPAGLSLSGGLDSTSVAAAVGWLRNSSVLKPTLPFHTYSWAFSQLKECDERHISDPIARHFGFEVDHFSGEEHYLLKDYPSRLPDRDDPMFGPFQGLIELANERASQQGVGVMLSGARGDATMGVGIMDYLIFLVSGQWRRLRNDLLEHSDWVDIPVRKIVRYYIETPVRLAILPPGERQWLRHGYRRLRNRPQPPPTYPPWVRQSFAQKIGLAEMLEGYLHPDVPRGFPRQQRRRMLLASGEASNILWLERAAGRYGLCFADPWSDRRLAEFSVAVPQNVLNRPRELKRLSRAMMRDVVPEESRLAAAKINPGPVAEKAMKEWARPTINHLLDDAFVAGGNFVNFDRAREYYASYAAGDSARNWLFWNLLTLEMWLRAYWQ